VQGLAEGSGGEVTSAKGYPGAGYDLVTFFECLHDMRARGPRLVRHDLPLGSLPESCRSRAARRPDPTLRRPFDPSGDSRTPGAGNRIGPDGRGGAPGRQSKRSPRESVRTNQGLRPGGSVRAAPSNATSFDVPTTTALAPLGPRAAASLSTRPRAGQSGGSSGYTCRPKGNRGERHPRQCHQSFAVVRLTVSV
jgi:hypothetical protein